MTDDDRLLLEVRGLRTTFPTDRGEVRAVDGVSFDVRRGEVLAVVGESGAGKSALAMSILGLLPTEASVTGEAVRWKGDDLLVASAARLRQVRGGEVGMIFQDPLSALNPVQAVGDQIGEVLRVHDRVGRASARARAVELLELVGISEPGRRAGMRPHELSGGMRQRVMIAVAIAGRPDLLIADEPTTALDVTVQAQVLDVLLSIKDEIDSAILLVTHDLGVVAGIADRVLVMYAGKVVELASTDEIFYGSRHPYTHGLLAALPRIDDEDGARLVPIPGAPPSPFDRSAGCPFHPRCPMARVPGVCVDVEPALRPVGAGDHVAACHFAEELG